VHGHAGHQRRHTANVGRVALLADAAQVDIVNDVGVNARPVDGLFEYRRSQVLRRDSAKDTAMAANGSTTSADDNNFFHPDLLWFSMRNSMWGRLSSLSEWQTGKSALL
jgi:hypothetical protein